MMQKSFIFFACGVAFVIILMMANNIFCKSDEYVGKHIQELIYERGQIHQEENSKTQEKLNGCEDQKCKKVYRQENGFSVESGHEER